MLRNSRTLLSCSALAGALLLWPGCGLDRDRDEASPDHGRAPATFNDDGTVVAGGHVYPDRQAFYRSPAFVQGNHRCGTPRPEFFDFLLVDPSDCTFSSTTIDPAYDPGQTLEIPMVFHLAERTDGFGHIPDSAVYTQLDIFNEDFRALLGTPGGNGSDAGIEFYLATEDPAGNPTTGINRYISDSYFNDPGGSPNQFKLDTNWDPSRYFNVYVNDAAGFLGYATFPQSDAETPEDGIVLLWSSIGRDSPNPPYHQGRTGTHEAGHYFGLFHTFQSGCGSSSAPYTTGDLIADTSQQSNSQFGCPTNGNSCGTPDPYTNYMNYTDDLCMQDFTAEQVNRMRCSIQHYRPNLVQAQGSPSAGFVYTVNGMVATFTDQSVDPDGTVVSWLWNFGDGNTSTAQNPSHTYADTGIYNVSLTVTDNDGRTGTASEGVPIGEPPSASFAFSVNGLGVQFSDTSVDPDGVVASWLWDFGDGGTSPQQNPYHAYAVAGTYTVTLQARDDDGLAAISTMDVTVSIPPLANFSYATSGLSASFSDESSDANGQVVAWSWDFGDGATATTQDASHTYAAGGVFPVVLTVTNDVGVTGSRTRQIAINAPPLAGFSFAADELTVSFTNESSDNDGVITSRSWDFGDGASSTEDHPTHTYGDEGSYTVTLTIRDNSGNESVATMDVEVSLGGDTPDAGPMPQPDASTGGGGDDDVGGCGCTVGAANTSRRGPAWPYGLLFGFALVIVRRRRR